MPRSKKIDEPIEAGMSRFLHKQDGSGDSPPWTSDSEESFITSLNNFIKGEFQKVNVELKDIRRNLGIYTSHLSKGN